MDNMFQIAVLRACLAALAVLLTTLAFAGVRKVGRLLLRNLKPVALAALLPLATLLTDFAGEKNTNMPMRVIQPVASQAFSSCGAVTNAGWLAHGAYEDWFRIPATNWWVRTADGWLDGVTVFAFCEFRPDIRTTNAFPRPFPQKLSLAPMANWHMLTNREALAASHESLFWHGVTGSNTLVMTWQNGLYARCATNIVSFQAELFNNGSVAYRYDGSPVATNDFVVPLELPFDRDGDGLENSVDPEPDVAGPDAHGTNAEWYNVVCSNVFSAVEGGGTGTTGILPVGGGDDLFWREGVNSNAYYFVDVVAERGPAPIRFTGDRTCRLGDPAVVALAGETNRVPLLIGISYAVTSDTPFSVSIPVGDTCVAITTNTPSDYEIRWPLAFMVSGTPDAYAVEAVPSGLDGVFEWGGGTGAPPMRSASCGYTASGGIVSFSCVGCGCGGCTASGCYRYEEAVFDLPILWCGCTGEGEPENEPTQVPHAGPESSPSVDISFGKSAVIFEDGYANTPTNWVDRRSSSATLTITAYGGVNGATLSVGGTKLSRLGHAGGHSLPSRPVTVYPGYEVTYSVVYEGLEASDSVGDIKVSASVTDGMTGLSRTDSATITSIRVELEVEKPAPDAPTCTNRHVYGVLENVFRHVYPSSVTLMWPCDPKLDFDYDTDGHFYCPLENKDITMTAIYGDAELPIPLKIIAPTVVCTGAEWRGEKGSIGDAGCVAMCLFYHVSPRTISFEGLHMEEVPVTDTPPTGAVTGYFSSVQTPLHMTHDVAMGAGLWWPVTTNAYWRMDVARAPLFPHPWSAGTLRWNVPMAWGYPFAGDTLSYRREVQPNPAAMQIYTMGEWGTATIEKSGHVIERNIFNGIWLDGVKVN